MTVEWKLDARRKLRRDLAELVRRHPELACEAERDRAEGFVRELDGEHEDTNPNPGKVKHE